jgi:hypothetical protein
MFSPLLKEPYNLQLLPVPRDSIYKIGPYEYQFVNYEYGSIYNPLKLKLLHTQHPVFIYVNESELTDFVGYAEDDDNTQIISFLAYA